jgi:peptidoglycan hydrolase CwlO-like protein
LKRFEVDEKSRKVQGLEQMIHEFELMAADLDRQVKAEEDRTGIKDPSHFNYSTFAKSAATRRNNLQASIEELRAKLQDSQRELDETLAEIGPRSDARDSVRPQSQAENGSTALR